MTKEQLFHLIGNTDEDLLDENVTPAAPRRHWRLIAGAAACLCICAAGAYLVSEGAMRKTVIPEGAAAQSGTESAAITPQLADLPDGTVYRITGKDGDAAADFIVLNQHEQSFAVCLAGAEDTENSEILTGTYTRNDRTLTAAAESGSSFTFSLYEEAMELTVVEAPDYPHLVGTVYDGKLNVTEPLKELSDIIRIDAEQFGYEDFTLDNDKALELLELLRSLTTYQEDASFAGSGNAYPLTFTVTAADGTTTTVMLQTPYVSIDGVPYRADSADCLAITDFIHSLEWPDDAVIDPSWTLHPFADLEDGSITGVSGSDPDAKLSEECLAALPELLRELTVYDTYCDLTSIAFSSTLVLTKADGTEITLSFMDFPSSYLNIDDTIYWIEEESLTELIQALTGTEAQGDSSAAYPAFQAAITSIGDGYVIVEGLDSNDINHRGAFSFGTKDIVIRRGDTILTLDDLEVGDTVSVTYTGEVLECYPASITAVEVAVLEE